MIFDEELRQAARTELARITNPPPVLRQQLYQTRQLAVDITGMIHVKDYQSVQDCLMWVRDVGKQPAMLALCDAFALLTRQTTVEERADFYALVDSIAFSGRPSCTMPRAERTKRREVVRHGVGHAVAYLEYRDTDPVESTAYFLDTNGGVDSPLITPCVSSLTLMLGMIAAYRTRSPIAL